MKTIISLFIIALLSACSTVGGNHLPSNVVGNTGFVRQGKVISMTAVTVKATRSYAVNALGATTGGVLGTALARKVGKGSGNQLAMLVGGVLGTAAGAAAMEGGYDRGTQFVLQFNGKTEAVILTANVDPMIRPGDLVQLVYFGGQVTNIQRL